MPKLREDETLVYQQNKLTITQQKVTGRLFIHIQFIGWCDLTAREAAEFCAAMGAVRFP